MTEIERVGILEWDLESVAKSLCLTHSEVREYFTDGRRVSFILERRICREIVQGTLPSEGAGFDLIDENGQKWEVRSITRGSGIYFSPSYMQGSGRRFDKDGFITKLSEIEGYFVGDVEKFPKIPVWKIPGSTVRYWYERGMLGAGTRTSRSKVLKLMRV